MIQREKSFYIYVALQNYLNEFYNLYTYFEETHYEKMEYEDEEKYFFRIIDYMSIDEICQKLCINYNGEMKAESEFIILNYIDDKEKTKKLAFVVTKFYFDNEFSFSIVLNLFGLTSDCIKDNIRKLKDKLKLEKIRELLFITKGENTNYTDNQKTIFCNLFDNVTPNNPFFILGNLLLNNTKKSKIKKNKEESFNILRRNYDDSILYTISTFTENSFKKLHITVFSLNQEINFTFEYLLSNLKYEYLDFIFNDDYDIQKFLENTKEFTIKRNYLKNFIENIENPENEYFDFLNNFKFLKENKSYNKNEIKKYIKIEKESISNKLENIIEKNENLILELQEDPKFLKHLARLGVLKDKTTMFEKYLYRKLFDDMGLYDLFLTEKNIENFLTKLMFNYGDYLKVNRKILFNNL